MELKDLRQEIDAVDDAMAKLLVRRMCAVDAVAAAKRSTGKAVLDSVREREILSRVAAEVGPELENEARILFTTLMSLSRARQRALLSEDGEPVRKQQEKTVVGIRGMGLIGGSFEKAFRKAGYEVVNLKDASSAEIGRCGLVIVCLPPLMVAPWIADHAADFAAGTIVTDAAGVKGVICPAVAEIAHAAKWIYVGAHPMAGKERSGYANAEADLFRGASMIFTPFDGTPQAVLDRLEGWFREIGFARFMVTDPQHHDEMIAYTSQLAHVVSSAYVQDELAPQHLGFSAGSFQDMTRVATVDPDMWTDLFLSNADSLDAVLSRLIARLAEYRAAIREKQPDVLRDLLARGRAAKESSH